jgi:hypothetical protein
MPTAHPRTFTRLVVVATLLASATAVFLFTRKPDNTEPIAATEARYIFLVPDLCKMRVELAADKRTDAYNSFYRRAHPALHTLVAELKAGSTENKALSARLQRAKTTVEASVLTFPKTIDTEVGQLLDLAGTGLQRLDSDSPTECEVS